MSNLDNKQIYSLYEDNVNKTGKDVLKEAPQYYSGDVTYQRDQKFIPISLRNFSSYEILGEDSELVFALDAHQTTGFVFSKLDIKHAPRTGIVPILRVSLRDTNIEGFKQAHALRIREAYSQKGIATTWYMLYVLKHGGIVSDFEHLEGGKRLWKSFVDTAKDRGLKVSIYNVKTKQDTPVDASTPESRIWSTDPTGRDQLIILKKGQSA